MPTAVVLGAQGTLGLALAGGLPEAGYTLVATPSRAECDIRDGAAVRALLDRTRPDVVFNAAGYTNVDGAEREPELAHAVNVVAVEDLARAARAAGAALVHYSTDYVFDGESERPYDERDTPAPLGVYARSKLEGEAGAAAGAERLFVLRVGCLYGRGGRNFPSTIVRRLRAGETILTDQDRLVSPTWVRDVVRASAALARTDFHGLYHCTAQGETSWVAFARLAAALLGVPEDRVQAVATGSLALAARRPRRAILDNRMLRLRGLDTLPPWQDGARAFVASELESPA